MANKDREIEQLKCRIAHGPYCGASATANTLPSESFDFNPYYMEENSPVIMSFLYLSR